MNRRNAPRKEKIILIAIVICVAALLAAGQGSDSESSGAAKVRALEHQRADAELHKDNFALDAIFDNSIIIVEDDGTMLSKADYLTRMRDAGPPVLEISVESMAVHSFGANTVVVDETYREKKVVDGRVYVERRRSMDTWTYKAGHWVCISAAAQPAR